MPAYKDEDRGTWYCRFYYKDWTNKNQRKTKRGFKSKRDALEYERTFILKASKSSSMSFRSLVELYISDASAKNREDTVNNKLSLINTKILPYFENKDIDKIDAADIRNWQNEINKLKTKQGKALSNTYKRSINSKMSSIFNFGVKFYGLERNPCYAAGGMGSRKSVGIDFWALDEFKQFIAVVDEKAYNLFFSILYWTGMRSGECLALHVKDVQEDNKIIINKTFKRKDSQDVYSDPKTENSFRVVTIPAILYNQFDSYIKSLYGVTTKSRVFYFARSALGSKLDKYAKIADVKRIRVHDLRHSHVALLIDQGYSTKLIAERIGDTEKTVIETYSHLYPNKHEETAETLNSLM